MGSYYNNSGSNYLRVIDVGNTVSLMFERRRQRRDEIQLVIDYNHACDRANEWYEACLASRAQVAELQTILKAERQARVNAEARGNYFKKVYIKVAELGSDWKRRCMAAEAEAGMCGSTLSLGEPPPTLKSILESMAPK